MLRFRAVVAGFPHSLEQSCLDILDSRSNVRRRLDHSFRCQRTQVGDKR